MSVSPGPTIAVFSMSRTLAEWLQRSRDYVALTRPRVLALVLFTASPALAIGREGWPSALVIGGVLLGAALVGAGCSALNAWIESDADAKMARTWNRPLPSGRLSANAALGFGVAVSALGIATLGAVGGELCAGIGVLTLAHYIGIYTLWLKPRSPQNIVIGGAAGAASPLIADAAVDGRLGIWGFALFAIVFLWTPPHFWAIALYRKHEYAAAGFPMMPAVVGDRATRWRMLAYVVVLIPVTLTPWFGGVLGQGYAAVATAGGLWFALSVGRAIRRASAEEDRRVFLVSIAYLSALFTAMLLELILT